MNDFGYIQVGVIILEVVLTIGAAYSSAKIYRFKNYYPMKQLSPLITLFQGFSFYVYQLMLVLSFYGKVQISWEDCQNGEIKPVDIKDKVVYLFLCFLYLLARGCCFTFTFAKSLRIILAFKGESLEKDTLIIRICQSEKILIVISFTYAFFSFPFAAIMTTLYANFQSICWLQVYENNYGGIYITSLIEEILTLILILKKKDHFRMNDKLLRFTLQLQCIFMAWIALNCLLAEYFHWINIIWASCWIRSIFMFCYGLLQPLCHKETRPAIYITQEKIENFKDIIDTQLNGFFNLSNYCLKYYLQYLKYLDQNNIQFKTASNELIQNFELFMLFEKLENQIRSGENHFNGGDKIFQIITENKALETHFYKKGTSDLQGELHNYFEDLFEKYFKKTNAYVSLQQFYISNTILQKNLYLLNIGINQFQLTNLMSENGIIQ